MNLTLDEQALPFLITEQLRAILTENVAEYGTGGGAVLDVLPCTRVWIASRDTELVGYAWLGAKRVSGVALPVNYFSQAVLPLMRGQGVGQSIREGVEGILRKDGTDSLYVQVNGNKEEAGLRGRQRLLRSGYAVERTQITESFVPHSLRSGLALMSDEELVAEIFLPLHFRKAL